MAMTIRKPSIKNTITITETFVDLEGVVERQSEGVAWLALWSIRNGILRKSLSVAQND